MIPLEFAPSRTWIKICGLRTPDDAVKAVEIGVDAIGLVFYPASPRFVEPQLAVSIARAASRVLKVGVFVNADIEEIIRTADLCGLDAVQLHGSEGPGILEKLHGLPVIKAFGKYVLDSPGIMNQYGGFSAWLVDSGVPSNPGGTGKTLDFGRVLKLRRDMAPLVLAGGLNSSNVQDAIRTVYPDGVDISSGVESSRGVKDHGKMEEFVRQVRLADENHRRA